VKALAVRQPYASLIISGSKLIENRSWATYYRGPLAIYASKTVTAADIKFEREFCADRNIPFPDAFPLGGIIGLVDLLGVFTPVAEKSGDFYQDATGQWMKFIQAGDKERCLPAFDDMTWYEDDSVGWVLANPRPVQFVKFSGRLGLFEVPDNLIVPCP